MSASGLTHLAESALVLFVNAVASGDLARAERWLQIVFSAMDHARERRVG